MRYEPSLATAPLTETCFSLAPGMVSASHLQPFTLLSQSDSPSDSPKLIATYASITEKRPSNRDSRSVGSKFRPPCGSMINYMEEEFARYTFSLSMPAGLKQSRTAPQNDCIFPIAISVEGSWALARQKPNEASPPSSKMATRPRMKQRIAPRGAPQNTGSAALGSEIGSLMFYRIGRRLEQNPPSNRTGARRIAHSGRQRRNR